MGEQKRKHNRRARGWRWWKIGVLGFTAVLVVVFVLSIWVPIGVKAWTTDPMSSTIVVTEYAIRMEDASLRLERSWMEYEPWFPAINQGRSAHGIRPEMMKSYSWQPRSYQSVWSPPSTWRMTLGARIANSSQAAGHGEKVIAYVPIVYLVIVLSLWSGWILVRTKRRFPAGSCTRCGYAIEGIDGSVCPECGAGSDG